MMEEKVYTFDFTQHQIDMIKLMFIKYATQYGWTPGMEKIYKTLCETGDYNIEKSIASLYD